MSFEGSGLTDSLILHNLSTDCANQLVLMLFEEHTCLSPCLCIAVACGCRTKTPMCSTSQLRMNTDVALLCVQSINP